MELSEYYFKQNIGHIRTFLVVMFIMYPFVGKAHRKEINRLNQKYKVYKRKLKKYENTRASKNISTIKI